MNKVALLLSLLLCGVSFSAERPNVIIILADDMAVGDLSSINGGLSSTPTLDAMAESSVVFENAYAGSPVCAPSRAAFLTGRYPHRTGSVTLNQIKHPELTRLHLDETTIADRFQANGYATGIVGKWHSGPGAEYAPRKRGFDESVVFLDSTDVETYFNYRLEHNDVLRHYGGEGYLTDILTKEAVDFVRRHENEPFFLHLAHYAPHRPLSAPDEVTARYLNKGLDENIAQVYAMVEIMDTGIGVLLDELDALGLAENTIVIFASDNGPDPLVGERFNGPLRGAKYEVTEGGIRVPFFVRWSGTLAPAPRSEPIHFTDIVPTLVEICGLEKGPQGLPLDGVSFAGLLSQDYGACTPPPQRFWQWNRKTPDMTHNAAVREGDWKLVKPFVTKNYPKGPSELPYQLYDLSTDPTESNDISAKHPGITDRLAKQYEAWFREVEAERVD